MNASSLTEMHVNGAKNREFTPTLQADPPLHWLQVENWRQEHCHFHLSQTLGQWLSPSAAEKDPPPGLWPAPQDREKVWTHNLTSAPGSGLQWWGQGSGGRGCRASNAQWSNVAHCWVHYHPVKRHRLIWIHENIGEMRKEIKNHVLKYEEVSC